MTSFIYHAEAQDFARSLSESAPQSALVVLHTQLLRASGAFGEVSERDCIECETLNVLWLYKCVAKVFDTDGDLPKPLKLHVSPLQLPSLDSILGGTSEVVQSAVMRLLEAVEESESVSHCEAVSAVKLFLRCYGNEDKIRQIVSGNLAEDLKRNPPHW